MTINEYLLVPPRTDGYSFKKKWMTTILPSIIGNEQRSALFTWPRRTLSFTPFANSAAELNYIKRKLFQNLHLIWGIPFWHDGTILSSQAQSNQKVLNVESTQYRNFEIGAPCILISPQWSPAGDSTLREVGTIASFTNNTQITLADNLGATWPAGTEVYPVLKAKINAEEQLNLLNVEFGDLSIVATEDLDSGITRHSPDISSFPVYPDIPVFNFIPESGSYKEILFHPYDYLSFLGKSLSLSNWGETGHRLQGDFFIEGKEAIWKYLDFFDSQKGRYGNFWIPTHHPDIRVTAAFASDATILTIDPIEYPTYWADSETARFVALRWPDGTIIYREIVDANSNTITIDPAIGKSCDTPGLLYVSFLLMARFDIDEIEAKYIMNDIATINLRFSSLPAETPE